MLTEVSTFLFDTHYVEICNIGCKNDNFQMKNWDTSLIPTISGLEQK